MADLSFMHDSWDDEISHPPLHRRIFYNTALSISRSVNQIMGVAFEYKITLSFFMRWKGMDLEDSEYPRVGPAETLP